MVPLLSGAFRRLIALGPSGAFTPTVLKFIKTQFFLPSSILRVYNLYGVVAGGDSGSLKGLARIGVAN